MTSTSTTPTAAPTAADLEAARLLLDRLGVSPADLLTATPNRAPAPTFADYIPIVRAAVSESVVKPGRSVVEVFC